MTVMIAALIALLGFPIVLHALISPEELIALHDLYYSTGGPSWSDRSNWMQSSDPCNPNATWFGIECDKTKSHVTGVILPNNLLTGTLQQTLGNLVLMDSLDLGCNKLTGSLPRTFARLAPLKRVQCQRKQHDRGSVPNAGMKGDEMGTLGLQSFLRTLGCRDRRGAPKCAFGPHRHDLSGTVLRSSHN